MNTDPERQPSKELSEVIKTLQPDSITKLCSELLKSRQINLVKHSRVPRTEKGTVGAYFTLGDTPESTIEYGSKVNNLIHTICKTIEYNARGPSFVYIEWCDLWYSCTKMLCGDYYNFQVKFYFIEHSKMPEERRDSLVSEIYKWRNHFKYETDRILDAWRLEKRHIRLTENFEEVKPVMPIYPTNNKTPFKFVLSMHKSETNDQWDALYPQPDMNEWRNHINLAVITGTPLLFIKWNEKLEIDKTWAHIEITAIVCLPSLLIRNDLYALYPYSSIYKVEDIKASIQKPVEATKS